MLSPLSTFSTYLFQGKKKVKCFRPDLNCVLGGRNNHYTTEAGNVILGKVLVLFLFHETSAGKMIASGINRAINSEKTM